MIFAFLSGPASVSECFLFDANLPAVKNLGKGEVGSGKWEVPDARVLR